MELELRVLEIVSSYRRGNIDLDPEVDVITHRFDTYSELVYWLYMENKYEISDQTDVLYASDNITCYITHDIDMYAYAVHIGDYPLECKLCNIVSRASKDDIALLIDRLETIEFIIDYISDIIN